MAKSKGKRKKNRGRRPEKRLHEVARQREKKFYKIFPEGLALLPDKSARYDKPKKTLKAKKYRRLKLRDKPTIRFSNKKHIERRFDDIIGTEGFYPNSHVRKVCKNRNKRRQILFIKRKVGKGKSGPKRRRYTEESKVRC